MRATPPPSDRHNPRVHLHPLGDGPWLRDASPADLWRRLLSWGLAMVLVAYGLVVGTKAIGWEPTIWLIVPLALGVMLIVTTLGIGLTCGFASNWTQVCPQCLGQMMRTATRCPHCHFTPSRSDG
jgi:hypothetical protein